MKRPFKVQSPKGWGQSYSSLARAQAHAHASMLNHSRRGWPREFAVLDRSSGERWVFNSRGEWVLDPATTETS